MPEEQWTPVLLTGELILLDICAVPGVAIAGKAVVNVGATVSEAVQWQPIQTQE